MGGFSLGHWLVVLAIVLLIFGTKRLRGAGRDLGEAVKGFKKGMQDDEDRARLGDQSEEAGVQAEARRHEDNPPR